MIVRDGVLERIAVFILFLFLSGCESNSVVQDNEAVVDDESQTCDITGIKPDPPLDPVLPEVDEIPEYSGGYSNCKKLPEINNGELELGEGCFKGCLRISGELTLTGAGSDKTVIFCDDKKKNGVIELIQGSKVIVQDLTISGSTRGIFIEPESSLTVSNVAISNVVKGGINVCNGEAVCQSDTTVKGLKISNVIPDKESGVSYGISMSPGILTIKNSKLSGFSSFAIALWGGVSNKVESVVENSVISDIYGGKTAFEGTAVYSEGLSELNIRTTEIKNAAVSFIYVSSDTVKSSEIFLEDVSMYNITAQDKEQGGLVFDGNIHAVLKRMEMADTRGYGIFSKGAVIDGSDISISGVSSDMNGENGFGIALFDGSSSVLNRLRIEKGTVAGFFMDGICKAQIGNFLIKDTGSDALGEFGIGAAVQEEAELIMDTGIIDSNRESGMMVYNASVTALNVDVRDTGPRKCYIEKNCGFAPGIPFGHGISLYHGSVMSFSGITVSGNSNGINMESSEISRKYDGKMSFIGNANAVNAWDIEWLSELEKALEGSVFCGNGSIFTTDTQPVRDGI